jgi:type IV pilus assembly protein PilX
MKRQKALTFRRRVHERGVVLILALIVLVAMIIAGVALVRSVDVTTQIAGNLAFRQAGVQATDAGVEKARQWLMAAPSLFTDIGPSYYSTWNGGVTSTPAIFDPATFDWSGKSTLPIDAAGNTVAYVVHRMCESAGDPADTTKNCITAPTSASGNSQRIKGGGEFGCTGDNCVASSNPYYRITVRVTGPRNTVTYTQVVIY